MRLGGVGMLLTAFSGIVVQFLYSNFFLVYSLFFSFPSLFSLLYLYLLIEEKFLLKPKISR